MDVYCVVSTSDVVAYYSKPMSHPTVSALQARIAALTDALSQMSDPPQSDGDAKPNRGAVDETIDALDKRLVGRSDRVRLRGALDKADAPLAGRPGADEAVGRIIRIQG